MIYTVGHSNHRIGEFLKILARNGVKAVFDVRSVPRANHRLPHFEEKQLSLHLEEAGIRYRFAGDKLGGRPSDPALYDEEWRVRYDLMSETADYQESIGELANWATKAKFAAALMCSEGDPLICHRTLLIAESLAKSGVEVRHILRDGSVELHETAVAKLMLEFGMPQGGDMFQSASEARATAFALKSRKAAYRAKDPKIHFEFKPGQSRCKYGLNAAPLLLAKSWNDVTCGACPQYSTTGERE